MLIQGNRDPPISETNILYPLCYPRSLHLDKLPSLSKDVTIKLLLCRELENLISENNMHVYIRISEDCAS